MSIVVVVTLDRLCTHAGKKTLDNLFHSVSLWNPLLSIISPPPLINESQYPNRPLSATFLHHSGFGSISFAHFCLCIVRLDYAYALHSYTITPCTCYLSSCTTVHLTSFCFKALGSGLGYGVLAALSRSMRIYFRSHFYFLPFLTVLLYCLSSSSFYRRRRRLFFIIIVVYHHHRSLVAAQPLFLLHH